jgi:3',5'-cyclic AMP phosphodiesterase CpdA
LTDLHVWRWPTKLAELLGKRSLGVLELAAGRSRRFQQERLPDVVAAVHDSKSDHVIITGDLTTLALLEEFEAARASLTPLLAGPERVTILPGNHDRYTRWATRHRFMERVFDPYLPDWNADPVKWIDSQTALLAFDPSRPGLSAQGWLPPHQLEAARRVFSEIQRVGGRWIVACHYPLVAPDHLQKHLRLKGIKNGHILSQWLSSTGRNHLYLCGHVHAVWAMRPRKIPNQLCLNAGPPTHVHTGHGPGPGFLIIDLEAGGDVRVTHRGWSASSWHDHELMFEPGFFAS